MNLWQNRDFLRLWSGQALSGVGSSVSGLAVPLIAVLTLQATPTQMGLLSAVGLSPFLLVGLFAGVWVDRLSRRSVIVVADIGRGVLFALILLLAVLGVLRIEHLYAIALMGGILTVFFEIAYMSYLPSLVGRELIAEANSKLEIGNAVVRLGGPSVGGFLISLVSAPFVILLNSLSFFVAAAFTMMIRTEEAPPNREPSKRKIWQEMGDGFRVIFGNRYLRSIAPCTATLNLFANMSGAVYILFATHELGLDAPQLGMIGTVSAIGALTGASFSRWVSRRVGLGPLIIGTMAISGACQLLTPLFAEPGLLALLVPMAAGIIGAMAQISYNINQLSFRQSITPDHLQGRTNSAQRFLVWGTMPIGALIGGLLGDQIGLRPTMLVGGVGSALAFCWVLFSPVRSLREQEAKLV